MKVQWTFQVFMGILLVSGTGSWVLADHDPKLSEDVVQTKHNLSSNPDINATGITQICVFCHTPHGGNSIAPGQAPLWNRMLPEDSSYNTYDSASYEGLDFAGRKGADVLAVGDGVVSWSGRRSGYGNLVEINHGNGYVTRYGHNQRRLVELGDTVKKGQQIALMGSTGRSTGPHVHFEVLHNGKHVNPAKYIGK